MNDKSKLKKLCAEIDAAYKVIRHNAAEAGEIIYGNRERVGDIMDDLHIADADGSDAESVIVFAHARQTVANKVKTILKENRMDLGELEDLLKDEES